ncbi:MAG: tryptophan--tRNA ligase [Vampirovibrionales bacterium]
MMSSTSPTPRRVMSGMRPTGQLHLGHYVGVLKNWQAMQHHYECYFMVADWHALTTKYREAHHVPAWTQEVLKDWLCVGLEPEKTCMYVQSDVPAISELTLMLSMLTPVKWLETDPTLKDMVAMMREKDSSVELHVGLLNYPLLQTADILAMLGELVPVGKDQVAHLEISRDIARRFNHTYQTQLFPEPKPLLTEQPVLLGVDGRKMGKSYNNGVYLADTPETTWDKLRQAITDPARARKTDPGNPDNCGVVFSYYETFASPDEVALTREECLAGTRGCMDCKKKLNTLVNETLAPFREVRASLETQADTLQDILATGRKKANETANHTLATMREAVFSAPCNP